MKQFFLVVIFWSVSFYGFTQIDTSQSNLQKFTPSQLIKDQNWDVKIFNSLYTQNKREDNGKIINEPRSNFFTTTFEVFTGVSKKSTANLGFIFNFKSNTINENRWSPLKFIDNKSNSARALTSVGISLKWRPNKNSKNFTIQSSFFAPIFEDQPRFFLDKRSYVIENRLFYDKTFPGRKFQLFTEIDFAYNFGGKAKDATQFQNVGERYANNSLGIPVSAFLSYFITSKYTALIYLQHFELVDLGNNFSQGYSLAGLGFKMQLFDNVTIEMSYSYFFQARGAGLGESYNFGVRYLLI
ncbi:MAG: hypothetical protein K0B10_01265 [Vicingaceae bacterium]|nr:hypothetical protein [Vicingaceae bacterium]